MLLASRPSIRTGFSLVNALDGDEGVHFHVYMAHMFRM
jgi:hypothetical protein